MLRQSEPPLVILGAGPTGIGAALRLIEHKHPFVIIDKHTEFGGLSRSFVDENGFTWDQGGHVLFSHYKYFDDWMDFSAWHDDFTWLTHQRNAQAWLRNDWHPYPIQNNIWRLPKNIQNLILAEMESLEEERRLGVLRQPENFSEWLLQQFGPTLCAEFMFPYNFKVWGVPPSMMNTEWMDERVMTPDIHALMRRTAEQKDATTWGPNNTFRFPSHGGTGAIWRSLGAYIKAWKGADVRLDSHVMNLNMSRRTLTLSTGEEIRYQTLINTVPLDMLLRMTGDRRLSGYASRFQSNSTSIIGYGFEGEPPERVRDFSWMYFPEMAGPAYRATIFSNYSPNHAPKGCWSLMCEVTHSAYKPFDVLTEEIRVWDQMWAAGLIPEGQSRRTLYSNYLQKGYPIPFKGRDELLRVVMPLLDVNGIRSRGRFGAWKYEVANQDHSFMQGVEVVDNILMGTPESTLKGIMGNEPMSLT